MEEIFAICKHVEGVSRYASHFAYKFIIRESLHVTLTSPLLYCFSFSFFEGIVNVSMLIYFFFVVVM